MSFAYQHAFYFLGVALAYIISFLLFRSPAGHRATNSLLGVAFFSMGWYNMIYLLSLTGAYARVYYLAGWGQSLCFLISPCAYLYVRQTLSQKSGLDRRDWYHFLPSILFFADMLPFNLGLTTISKSMYVDRVLHDFNQFYLQKVSFIPLRWHFALRPLQAILYLFFQWRLLFQGRLGGSKRIFRWLLTLTVLQTFFYCTLAMLTYEGLYTGAGFSIAGDYQHWIYFLYICFLIASVTLLTYPEAIYGSALVGLEPERKAITVATVPVNLLRAPVPVAAPVPAPSSATSLPAAAPAPAEAPSPTSPPEPRPVNGKVISQYLPILQTYLETDKPYLQPKWSIQDMAVATRIPVHQLSYIINQHYKIRYTDLMNQYRVEYAKTLFAEGVWKELSLEGLGKRAGFSNRTNFFLVFKKMTGQSPSDYLSTLKTQDIG